MFCGSYREYWDACGIMEKYENRHISEMPLSSPFFRKKVENFLGENGLRMEALDVYCAIEDEDGNILAGAGLSRDIIKCIAVASQARQEGLVAPLVSHLISLASARGILELKLFTKPENQAIFESLGFHVLASAPKAILMENGRGLERYCAYLHGFSKEGRCGIVVMNANPFTLGHQYLLEQAAQQVDTLYVIPVKEDLSQFPYTERLAMIRAACTYSEPTSCHSERSEESPVTVRASEENYFLCSCSKNQFSSEKIAPGSSSWQKIGFSQSVAKNNFLPSKAVVLEGSDYQISAATFPTYFLKDLSDAAETQMRLDLDLFARHIAPALNASVRFVGSEPLDALTNHYNTLMWEVLPIEVVEIPRLKFAAAGDKAEGNYFLCGCSKNQFPSAETTPTSPSTEENYFSQGFAKNQFSSAIANPTRADEVCHSERSEESPVISSTQIRKALEEGRVTDANAMLGYRYGLFGVVVAGNRMGRTIGFPTANMQLYEPLKLVPKDGVYAVEVEVMGKRYKGMCNIGVRPTVDGKARTIETHILDFEEDIYGLPLQLRFVRRIRDERKFPSLDALKVQLMQDKIIAKLV